MANENENLNGPEVVEPGASGAAEGPEAEVASLAARLAESEAQAAEYLDNWRRATADLSNARKRMQREQAEIVANAAARVIERLLPVIDDMERAFSAVPAEVAGSDWVNGFRMIQRKLEGILQAEGVTPIPAAGQLFDPSIHEAVTHEEAPGYEEGMVIGEVARGYKLGERVLRPAMVRVAKGS